MGSTPPDGGRRVLWRESDLRFAVLVLAALGTSFWASDWIYLAYGGGDAKDRIAEARCLTGPGSAAQALTAHVGRCLGRSLGSELLPVLAIELAFLGAVAVVFVLLPVARSRRRELTAPAGAGIEPVLGEIRTLAVEAGLERAPAVLWDPLDRGVRALVFGLPGRRTLQISGGAVVLHYTDPDVFRALVRHELGHLRHGDIDRAYLVVASVVALATMFAVALVSVLTEHVDYLASIAWRAALLYGLVHVAAMSVLRARELEADRYAADHGARAALERIFASGTTAGRSREWLRAHPSPRARLANLTLAAGAPRPVLTPASAFVAGVLATVGAGEVFVVASLRMRNAYWAEMLSCACFLAPLAAWLVLVCDRDRPARIRSLLVSGGALGAGVLVGAAASLENVSSTGPGLPGLDARVAVVCLATIAAAAAFAGWIDTSLGAWRAWRGRRVALILPTVAGAAGVAVAAAALLRLVLYEWSAIRAVDDATRAEYHRLAAAVGPPPEALWMSTYGLAETLVSMSLIADLAVVCLWAIPVVGIVVSQRRADPIVTALRASAVAVAGCLIALLVLRATVHHRIAPDRRGTIPFLLALESWQVGFVLAAQCFAAALATWRARSRRIPVALLAAWVTGAIGAIEVGEAATAASRCVGALSIVRSRGCRVHLDPSFDWQWIRFAGTVGVGLALVVAVAAAGAESLVRGRLASAREDRAGADAAKPLG